MHLSSLRYPGCKWNKHLVLQHKEKLQAHLPQTDLFDKHSFVRYLEAHPIVFLKPSLGGGGKDVYKITRQGSHLVLHSTIYKKNYSSKAQLYYDLKQRCGKKKYIIQQGIDLLKIDERVVDFRVVLLKPENNWQCIGIMGKCAAKHKFVTNHTRGGRSIRLEPALKRGLQCTDEECEKFKGKLEALSLDIAHSLNETYYNITELGLDIAIDKRRHMWLLEANTKPQFKLFKDHEDRTLFQKIASQTRRLRSSSP